MERNRRIGKKKTESGCAPRPARGKGRRGKRRARNHRRDAGAVSRQPLPPKVWYRMPAYAEAGKVVCFFRCVIPSRAENYMTFGFTE